MLSVPISSQYMEIKVDRYKILASVIEEDCYIDY